MSAETSGVSTALGTVGWVQSTAADTSPEPIQQSAATVISWSPGLSEVSVVDSTPGPTEATSAPLE